MAAELVIGVFGQHGWPAPGPAGDPDGSLRSLPPQARERLLYSLGQLAIKFVSGPGAIASVLRAGLLPSPFNTKSVPIDIGYSDRIPESVRRGVIARARGRCEWPGGCDRSAAASDVHHLTHKSDGGPTSVAGCGLFCEFHHLVCIHRWGWRAELRADGVMIVYGPDGQILTGHPPPGRQGPPVGRAA